jgi:hypothetical protein
MQAISMTYPRLTVVWLGLLAALAATSASAQESVQISETQEISATIIAVDQELRLITLRGPQGNLTAIEAGPEVRNLAQIEVGDTLRVVYEQLYIATLTGAEVASPVTDVAVGAVRAEAGEMPGGAVGTMSTIMVTIESIGPEGRSATFRGPDGRLEAIDVQTEEGREFSRGLNTGDVVQLTFAEALAIMVEPLEE